jgi:SAM-dependent methyltransferase
MSNDADINAKDLTHAGVPPVAHPLAMLLAQSHPHARVLLLGVGSGRNIPVLLAANALVEALDDVPERVIEIASRYGRDVRVACGSYTGPFPFATGFAAALSTNALLHGCESEIAAAVGAVRAALAAGGLFYATLGSTRDPRCGMGRRIAERTYVATDGSEAGVTHTYFDAAGARRLFGAFDIEELAETAASETAGRWAHTAEEARSLVHWFVRARAPN